MVYKTLDVLNKSNQTLEYGYVLRSLPTARSSLIQDISLNTQRYYHRIQILVFFLLSDN